MDEVKQLLDNLVGLTEFEQEARLLDCVLLDKLDLTPKSDAENLELTIQRMKETKIHEFLFLVNKMEANPDWGIWKGFDIKGDELKCRWCHFTCSFNLTKRWSNLAQHLARIHPFKIGNCRGLPQCEKHIWLKRLRK